MYSVTYYNFRHFSFSVSLNTQSLNQSVNQSINTDFFASVQLIDANGGVMFSGCPSVCACARARMETFSDGLAVNCYFEIPGRTNVQIVIL